MMKYFKDSAAVTGTVVKEVDRSAGMSKLLARVRVGSLKALVMEKPREFYMLVFLSYLCLCLSKKYG